MKNEIIYEQIKNMSFVEKRNRILRTDHFFKYLMLDNLNGDASIIKLIIEEATGFNPRGIILSGNGMPSGHKDGKIGRLDLRIIDDKRQQYDIEMQCDYLEKYENVRFQVYLAKLLISGERKGEDYSNIPPVFVICLVDKRYSDMLIDHYLLVHKDELTVLEENRLNLIFINLSYIDTILKTKRLSELSVFEKLVYLFKKRAY